MGTDDKIGNKAEELNGKVKETTGKATDDESLEAEGKADQRKSSLKQAGRERQGRLQGLTLALGSQTCVAPAAPFRRRPIGAAQTSDPPDTTRGDLSAPARHGRIGRMRPHRRHAGPRPAWRPAAVGAALGRGVQPPRLRPGRRGRRGRPGHGPRRRGR